MVFYDSTPANRAGRGQYEGREIGADAVRDARSRRQFIDQAAGGKGNVIVTQKDQVVTGDTAIFDTKTNLITMLGGSC